MAAVPAPSAAPGSAGSAGSRSPGARAPRRAARSRPPGPRLENAGNLVENAGNLEENGGNLEENGGFGNNYLDGQMVVFGGKFWMVNQFCVSRKQPLAKIEDQPTRKMAQLWLMYWPDFFRHMGLSF